MYSCNHVAIATMSGVKAPGPLCALQSSSLLRQPWEHQASNALQSDAPISAISHRGISQTCCANIKPPRWK